jgi:hypothetical protein
MGEDILQITNCLRGQKNDASQCTRHAIMTSGSAIALVVYIWLIIKQNNQPKLKKKIDTTKKYLLYSLILFDISTMLHFGIHLSSSNWLKGHLPLITKIIFSICMFLLFYYLFQKVLRGIEQKAKWLKLIMYMFLL